MTTTPDNWNKSDRTLTGFPPALTIAGDREVLFWNGGASDLYLEGLLPALAVPGRQVYLYERWTPGRSSALLPRQESPHLHFRPTEEPIRHERPAAFVATSAVPILRRAALNVLLLHDPAATTAEAAALYDFLVFSSKWARHSFLAAHTLVEESRTMVIPMGHFADHGGHGSGDVGDEAGVSAEKRTNTVVYIDDGADDSFEKEIWPAIKERVPDASLVKVHPDESFLAFSQAISILRTAKVLCYLPRQPQIAPVALIITAQAEGVVPVVRKSGALPESVSAGVVYSNSDTLESRALMIEKISSLLTRDQEWESLSGSARVGIRRHRDWKSIAERWAVALKL